MCIPTMDSHVVGVRTVGNRAPGAPLLAFLAALALTSGAVGCTKKDDGPRPAQLAPASSANVPTAPPAPVPPPTAAVGAPAPAGSAGATITGKITLAPERRADVTPNDVVYLVARRVPDNPAARGSLVAVKRFSASSFPIDFTLGASDMMFKNGAFEGDLTVAARVDKDGDPMTRRKGDVFGTVDRVKVGAAGVEIKLDHLQQEDESLAGGAPPMQGGMPPGHP